MSGTKPHGQHREKRLTAATVRNLNQPGLHGDGNGLYLKVDRSGAKRWIQRLVIHGNRRDIGLGSAKLVSLAEAREGALENRKLARQGGDPVAAKRRSEAVLIFSEAAQRVHDLQLPNWRNPKHGKQWLSTLESYAFPHFGSKRIDTVSSADVLHALSAIWNEKPETARRVKQRIGSVFKWAMAQGWRTDNPADTISKALPQHDRSKIVHRKALPYSEVANAIAEVRRCQGQRATQLAFEFLVLTATRSGETRLARWEEINSDKGDWTIPAARMKTKKPHRVPLSDRCIEILREARKLSGGQSELVFPSETTGKALSDMTLSKLMRELEIPAVPHGFRSSFRDWAGEQTNHPREVIEFALAHVIRDKAEAAYARSDLYEKRKKLMGDWEAYLSERVE